MSILRKWLPSIIMVAGSTIFLLLTLRRAGPSGAGVPAMLQMQSAWRDAPAIHASGAITESRILPGKDEFLIGDSAGANHLPPLRFDFWKGSDSKRRVTIEENNGAPREIVVFNGDHAWKWTRSTGRWEDLDPDKASVDPVPDPDSANGTFYRWVKEWTLGGTETLNGLPCTRIIGTREGGRFTFFLDNSTHFPRRVALDVSEAGHAGHTVVDYLAIETPAHLPEALFSRTVSVTEPGG